MIYIYALYHTTPHTLRIWYIELQNKKINVI